jgi:uncharacterized membrane protein
MTSSHHGLTLTFDPAPPWSSSAGLPALGVVALLLIGLTVWTYYGVTRTSLRRVFTLLGLRLAAALLAVLALLRPSLAYRDEMRVPSVLLFALDGSESMSIQDEIGSQTRWGRLQQVLKDCEPELKKLQDEQNVNVVLYRFANEVADYDPGQPADGKRTDFGQMLHTLFDRHRGERLLRGLVILSDGADNGPPRFEPLTLAGQWRNLPCPLQTFALGKKTTNDQQSNVSLVSITPEPSQVSAKGELTLKAVVDAPGFENKALRPHLFIEDQEVPARVFMDGSEILDGSPVLRTTTPADPQRVAELLKGLESEQPVLRDRATQQLEQLGQSAAPALRQALQGNLSQEARQRVEGVLAELTNKYEFQLKCNAPPTPGEIKVTVKIDPLPGEKSLDKNKEISTFVTITKEGISVLLVDTLGRYPEPQEIKRTLGSNPRFRVSWVFFSANEAPTAGQRDLLQFDQQAYDVILLGDLTPAQLAAGNPRAATIIEELVRKGTGVLMMGGEHTFANSDWKNTKLADLLPVDLTSAGPVTRPGKLVPVESQLDHFVLRLADTKTDNLRAWDSLRDLGRITRMGKVKEKEATLLANSTSGDPVLAWKQYGEGRVMALAANSTIRWVRDPTSKEIYTKFWEHLVIWLARQEETGSSIRIKLRTRRLAAGDPLEFEELKLLNKTDLPVPGAHFEITVTDPNGNKTRVPSVADQGGDRGTIWNTQTPGEYKIEVTGKGKDAEGNEITGSTIKPVRFLVYQDDAETARRAADHDFLKKLATAGGGAFHRVEELPQFLRQLAAQPVLQGRPKAHLMPDWRRDPTFLFGFFLAFVTLLCVEWFLRRRWGLV